MAVKPNIILFDEPTAALDPSLIDEVTEIIRNLAKKRTTMLIVTHEMKFAGEIADKVIFMSNGTVIEQGTPQEIFEHPRETKTRQFLKLASK